MQLYRCNFYCPIMYCVDIGGIAGAAQLVTAFPSFPPTSVSNSKRYKHPGASTMDSNQSQCFFYSYQGNSLQANYRAGSLPAWEGGLEGDPLVLFPSGASYDNVSHPPAMIISVLTQPKSVIGSPLGPGIATSKEAIQETQGHVLPNRHMARVDHEEQPTRYLESSKGIGSGQEEKEEEENSGPGPRYVSFGVQGLVEELTNGFSYSVVLLGRQGISATQMAWGNIQNNKSKKMFIIINNE